MKRDFVFFVNGVPDDRLVRDEAYFLAPTDIDFRSMLHAATEKEAGVQRWLQTVKSQFCVAGFRVDCDDDRTGFRQVYQRLSGLLDVFSVLLEDSNPTAAPLVLIRGNDDKDGVFRTFGHRATAVVNSKDGIAEEAWRSRNLQVFQSLLPLFDVVATDNPKLDTELGRQLSLSTKMYRHGQSSDSYGVEFLCKFTALEGLVCGPLKTNKQKALKCRLKSLFRHRNDIETDVGKLWVMRCEGSHQGKAFSSEYVAAIGTIEALFLGSLAFAVDHIASEATVESLWLQASAFALPAEIIADRPTEIVKLLAIEIWGGVIGICHGIGPLIDRSFGDS